MSTTQPMTEAEAMRSTTRRVFEEVVNGRNLDLLPQFFTEDFTWHLGARDATGLDQVREVIQGYLTAFPDLRITVEQQIVEGNLICTRFSATGTLDGPLEDVEPTGKRMDITAMNILRFEGTKIAEEWESFDEVGMLKQIGVISE